MFTTKLNIIVPVLGVTIALIEPAFAVASVPAPVIGAGLPAIAVLAGGYWLIKKGPQAALERLQARYDGGDGGMLTTKLNFVALALLGAITASIEPALAGPPAVPAPILGAGLPVLTVLGGGYWLVKKLRERR